MASNLLLPDGMAPSNLHLRPSVKARYVDGDMFNICERLAEISTRLYIVELEDADAHCYAIMESADDGVEMLVCKVKELDARVLENVQKMLFIPFEHRLAAIEAENKKFEDDHHQNLLDATYDKIGGQFARQLWHDGFVEHRPTSYPKVGVAAPKRAR